MSWADRPDIAPGGFPRGDEIEAMLDQIESLTDPTWTSWTPTWTSTGTTPSLGNGTIVATYRRSVDSNLVIARFILTWGSTTNGGTGIWSFTLPVTASAGAVNGSVGAAMLLDAGTLRRSGGAWIGGTTTFSVITSSGDVTATSPHTWATGDILGCTIPYEPA